MKKKKWILIAALILFFAAVGWFAGRPLVRFASDPAAFREWVEEKGIWGRLAFVGMVLFQVIFALIPGEPFEIAAGYAFGFWEGTALCIFASGMGSMLVFLLVKKYGVKLVELFFSREKLEAIRPLLQGHEILYLLLFMVPGTPKDLLSYAAGLTDLKPAAWLIICSLGRIPSVVTSTAGGNLLGGGKILSAAAVFAGTLLVSLAGLLIYRRVCRDTSGNEQ